MFAVLRFVPVRLCIHLSVLPSVGLVFVGSTERQLCVAQTAGRRSSCSLAEMTCSNNNNCCYCYYRHYYYARFRQCLHVVCEMLLDSSCQTIYSLQSSELIDPELRFLT